MKVCFSELADTQTSGAHWSHGAMNSAIMHHSIPLLCSHPGLLFDWSHQSKCDENGWNHTEINLSFTLRQTWSKHSLKGTFSWSSTHLFICLSYSEVWGDSPEWCFIKIRLDKVSWMLFYISSFIFFSKEEKNPSKLQRETEVLLRGDPEAISILVTCCTT